MAGSGDAGEQAEGFELRGAELSLRLRGSSIRLGWWRKVKLELLRSPRYHEREMH